jgi:hypothetical protein
MEVTEEQLSFQLKAAAVDFALRLNMGNNNISKVIADTKVIYEFLKGEVA